MNECDNSQERRQFYRVDDNVIMNYHVLDEREEAIPSIEDSPSNQATFELIEQYSQLSQQMGTRLGRISERSPDIAYYLKSLDSKIELLAQMFLSTRKRSETEPKRLINLGAGGMAFGTDEKLLDNTLIKIHMILSPDFVSLHLKGRVVEVKHQVEGDYPYRLCIEFVEISEVESDKIIKHVMKIQSSQLRAEREKRQQD